MRLIIVLALIFSTLAVYAQIPEKAEDVSPLLIGEKIPETQVLTIDGKSVSTSDLFKAGKTIVIFYRGGWCPYCNTHLNEVGQVESELRAMGYTIVAVSPDAPENLKKSIDKNKLTYTLVSDKTGALAKAVGIAFRAPQPYEKLLTPNQGEEAELHLPVPALFLINEEGEILFEYINPNYKKRMSGDLLLSTAKVFAKKN
ncbi:MAG: AhpC/TSA family protein [Cyclobacteriaceae bacterium]|nr:AhpC/TSA family protein [Cyclobacteriaceae bacterium]